MTKWNLENFNGKYIFIITDRKSQQSSYNSYPGHSWLGRAFLRFVLVFLSLPRQNPLYYPKLYHGGLLSLRAI